MITDTACPHLPCCFEEARQRYAKAMLSSNADLLRARYLILANGRRATGLRNMQILHELFSETI